MNMLVLLQAYMNTGKTVLHIVCQLLALICALCMLDIHVISTCILFKITELEVEGGGGDSHSFLKSPLQIKCQRGDFCYTSY